MWSAQENLDPIPPVSPTDVAMEHSKNTPLDIAIIADHLGHEQTSHFTPKDSIPDVPQRDKEFISDDTNLEAQKLEAASRNNQSSLPKPSRDVEEATVKEEDIPGLDNNSVEVSVSAVSRPEHPVDSKTQERREIPLLPDARESSLSTLLAKHNLELVSSNSSDEDSSETASSETTEDSESESEDESDSSSASNDSIPANKEDGTESEEEATKKRIKAKKRLDKMIGDDTVNSGSESDDAKNRPSFATAHEIISPSVSLPSITEIPDTEPIELIGEILTIVDSVVVVKSAEDGMQRVLDTESLLVFEDRKVLGLVFETFGPLSAPLYSIRFPSSAHIPTNTSISRQVFYCPQRSTFAYTSGLRLQRGNDASNFYDEEVGEEEIDFSDDEAERQWKMQKDIKQGRKKRRRDSKVGSRVGSVTGDHDAHSRNENTILPYDDDFMGQEAPSGLSYEDPYAEPLPKEEGTSATKPSPGHDLPSRRTPRVHTDPSSAPYSRERHGNRGRGGGRGRGHGPQEFQPRRSSGRGSALNRNNGYYDNNYGGYDDQFGGPSNSTQYDPSYPPSYHPAFAGNHPMPPFHTAFQMNPGAFNNTSTFFNGMNQAQFPGPVNPFLGGPTFQATHFGMRSMGGPTIGPGTVVPGAHINPRFAMQFALMNGTVPAPEALAAGQNTHSAENDAPTESLNVEKPQ